MDIKSLVRKEVAELSAYHVDEQDFRVKLDAMENPYPLPYELRKELSFELAKVALNRYPDAEASALKAELASYIGAPEDRLIVGNGSDELIAMIISAFGGSPGTVAYMDPSFAMYRIISRSLGQDVLPLPLDREFDIDFDGSLKLIMDKRPNVLFIAYPNNPTGNLFTRDKVRRLVAGFTGIAVVDEAYHSFSGDSFVGELEDNPNLIVLRTLSKVGLAGLRVGMMAANPDVVDAVNRVRLPYNVNSLSQAAATIVLRHGGVIDEQVAMILSERDRLFKALAAISGVTVYPTATNFIMFRLRGATEAFRLLKKEGILIKNLDSPGPLKDCLRVTIGTPAENDEFLAKFTEIVS